MEAFIKWQQSDCDATKLLPELCLFDSLGRAEIICKAIVLVLFKLKVCLFSDNIARYALSMPIAVGHKARDATRWKEILYFSSLIFIAAWAKSVKMQRSDWLYERLALLCFILLCWHVPTKLNVFGITVAGHIDINQAYRSDGRCWIKSFYLQAR